MTLIERTDLLSAIDSQRPSFPSSLALCHPPQVSPTSNSLTQQPIQHPIPKSRNIRPPSLSLSLSLPPFFLSFNQEESLPPPSSLSKAPNQTKSKSATQLARLEGSKTCSTFTLILHSEMHVPSEAFLLSVIQHIKSHTRVAS